MKKYFIGILIAVAFITAISGCGKEMVTYDGESGIYFDTIRKTDGGIYYNFGTVPVYIEEGIINYRVNLIGKVADYDRPFEFEVIENDTLPARLDVDYKMLTPHPVIKAGEAFTYIQFSLSRKHLIGKKEKVFTVRLLPNEHFRFLYPYRGDVSTTMLTQYFSEDVPYVMWWKDIGELPFGPLTATKSNFICDYVNAHLDPSITRERWYLANDIQTTVGIGRMKFFGIQVQKYLDEMTAAGTPVWDEPKKITGEKVPMRMGDISQNQDQN